MMCQCNKYIAQVWAVGSWRSCVLRPRDVKGSVLQFYCEPKTALKWLSFKSKWYVALFVCPVVYIWKTVEQKSRNNTTPSLVGLKTLSNIMRRSLMICPSE